ncbi:hypothetical protein FHX77_000771 [Bifidobacterium commune]|nr:hypothetical protein [Bifidobacterium commune]MBB2955363.1 hypothetical protein [Bifidobacterium commune]
MTNLKDSNNADDRNQGSEPEDRSVHENTGQNNIDNDHGRSKTDLWKQFEEAHADDLDDISNSRSAKQFEKQAKRREKKTALSVTDITPDSFVDNTSMRRGPRDFENSWLDTEDVLDRFDDFIPPNPSLGHLNPVKCTFWALFLIGIAGLIAALYVSQLTTIMGVVFGSSALIGGVGLLTMHRTYRGPGADGFNDGAQL